jgi:hypothetical protein
MLEPDALQRVRQLDINTKVVRIQLQAIARAQAACFIHIERQRRDRAVDVESPVAIA